MIVSLKNKMSGAGDRAQGSGVCVFHAGGPGLGLVPWATARSDSPSPKHNPPSPNTTRYDPETKCLSMTSFALDYDLFVTIEDFCLVFRNSIEFWIFEIDINFSPHFLSSKYVYLHV